MKNYTTTLFSSNTPANRRTTMEGACFWSSLTMVVVLTVLLNLISLPIIAQNYSLNGNWKSPSAWTPSYPGPTIVSGETVTVTGNSTVNTDVVFEAGATLNIGTGLTLVIGNNQSLTMEGDLNNDGTLQVGSKGLFTNSGTVNNNNGAILLNFGNTVNAGDLVNNSDGDMAIPYGVDNRGVFSNTGMIGNAGEFRYATSATDDSFTNETTGDIMNMVGSTLFGTGPFTNDGAISNSGTLDNRDVFTNNATILNDGIVQYAISATDDSFTSDGVIVNQSSGEVYGNGAFTNTGQITNSGLLDNRGNFENAMGGEIENVGTFRTRGGDAFNNSGAFTNANAAVFENFGTVTNNGVFTNKAIGLVDNRNIFSNGASGAITNEGIFDATVAAVDDIFTNDGTFNNNNGGELSNRNDLINNGTLNNNTGATFTNNGVLGAQGTVTNSGTGAIANMGTIDNNSVFNNEGKLNNEGDLDAGQNAADDSFTNSGTLGNSGNITGRGIFTNATSSTWSNEAAGTMSLLSAVTFINNGVLINNGNVSIAGAGAISQVDAAAEVSGTGTFDLGINTFIVTGGSFAPGNSIGTLTIDGSLTLGAGTTLNIEIDTPPSNDQLCVTGTFTMAGDINLIFLFTPTISTSYSYDVITCVTTFVGAPASYTLTPAHTPSATPMYTIMGSTAKISFSLSVLPIDLLSFEGQQENDAIRLNWQTASEEDNDYMAVERSEDGKTFDEIGRIEGKGTTTEAQNYTLIDHSPQPGVNYYRLRQVDFDGTTEYHPVIAVQFTGDRRLSVRLTPNPVREELGVNWIAPGRNDARLRLLDLQGRLRDERELPPGSGLLNLPVDALPAGVYFLQIIQGTRVETRRFVKQ